VITSWVIHSEFSEFTTYTLNYEYCTDSLVSKSEARITKSVRVLKGP